MRRYAILALLVAGRATAMDPPHTGVTVQGMTTPIGCSSCHMVHNALGGALTNQKTEVNLCNSCHTTSNFGFPGGGGDHHRWDAPAVSPDHDAVVPDATAYPEMAIRVVHAGNKISCAVCHDQHDGATVSGSSTDGYAAAGGQHVSQVAQSGSGLGTMTPVAVSTTAPAKSYVLVFTAGGAVGSAAWQVSFDNGLSFGETQLTAAGPMALDSSVSVTFDSSAGPFVTGEQYSFYVAYPLLRYPNQKNGQGSQLCNACHPARVQSALRARGDDLGYLPDGVRTFSHPVGEVLGQNPYAANDRGTGQGAILDASGSSQSAVMPPSQRISLDVSGSVHCGSCHYPHNADSSSISVNPR